MMNMQFADMSSSGYWYHDAIMSTYILALRPEGKNATSHAKVKAHIETNMRDFLAMTNKSHAPSQNIARTWKKEIPGHPEEAWNSGKYEIGDLPRWASQQLDRDAMKRNAIMSQAPGTEYGHTTMRNSASSQIDSEGQGLGPWVLAGVGLWGLWRLLNSNRVVEGSARPVERTPLKRLTLLLDFR